GAVDLVGEPALRARAQPPHTGAAVPGHAATSRTGMARDASAIAARVHVDSPVASSENVEGEQPAAAAMPRFVPPCARSVPRSARAGSTRTRSGRGRVTMPGVQPGAGSSGMQRTSSDSAPPMNCHRPERIAWRVDSPYPRVFARFAIDQPYWVVSLTMCSWAVETG